MERKEEKLEIEKLPMAAAWASNELRRKPIHTKVSQGCGSSANRKLRGMRGGVVTGAEYTADSAVPKRNFCARMFRGVWS